MNLSCDVIRDILPLYAEDMVSGATRELVDEHLCGCDGCTKELAALKKAPKVPVEEDTGSLKRIGAAIHKKQVLTVLTVLMFAVTIVLGGTMLLDAPIYLSASDAIINVEALEGGRLCTTLSDYVVGTGSCGSGRTDTMEPTGNYGIIAWTRLSKLLLLNNQRLMTSSPDLEKVITMASNGQAIYQLEGGATSQNFWYCSAKDGTGVTLLWDAGNNYYGTPLIEVNYHLGWYCGILVILAAAFLFIRRCFHCGWCREACVWIAIAAGSLSLSTVIACAGQFMELWGEFTDSVMKGSVLAVPMIAAVGLARQLYLLNQKEKMI